MARYIKTTVADTRLHQHFNSIQFGSELLTLREAANRGYLKLNPIPGKQTPTPSIKSFSFTEKGMDSLQAMDGETLIDPEGNGVRMSVDEALAKELIRPIKVSVMVGYEVV